MATAAQSVCRETVLLADSQLAVEREGYLEMDEDMRNCLSCAYSRIVTLDAHQEERLAKIKGDVKVYVPICHEISLLANLFKGMDVSTRILTHQ